VACGRAKCEAQVCELHSDATRGFAERRFLSIPPLTTIASLGEFLQVLLEE